jgi:hypothetical protein
MLSILLSILHKQSEISVHISLIPLEQGTAHTARTIPGRISSEDQSAFNLEKNDAISIQEINNTLCTILCLITLSPFFK